MSIASGTPASEESLRREVPAFLVRQRWFGSKARSIGAVDILDIVPMKDDRVSAELILVLVHFADHYTDETYCVPLLSANGRSADFNNRATALATSDAEWPLRDALTEPDFLGLLLRAIAQGLMFTGRKWQGPRRSNLRIGPA